MKILMITAIALTILFVGCQSDEYNKGYIQDIKEVNKNKFKLERIKDYITVEKINEIDSRINNALSISLEEYMNYKKNNQLKISHEVDNQLVRFHTETALEKIDVSFRHNVLCNIVHKSLKTELVYSISFYPNGNIHHYCELVYPFRKFYPKHESEFENIKRMKDIPMPNGIELYFMEDGNISAYRNYKMVRYTQFKVGKELAWNLKGEKTFDKDYKIPVKMGFKKNTSKPEAEEK